MTKSEVSESKREVLVVLERSDDLRSLDFEALLAPDEISPLEALSDDFEDTFLLFGEWQLAVFHVGDVFKHRLEHLRHTVARLLVVALVGPFADLVACFVSLQVEHVVIQLVAQTAANLVVVYVPLGEGAKTEEEGGLLAEIEDECWVDCLVALVRQLEAS
jgi:hypothetical protein